MMETLTPVNVATLAPCAAFGRCTQLDVDGVKEVGSANINKPFFFAVFPYSCLMPPNQHLCVE